MELLHCKVCGYKITRWEIQLHTVACELEAYGYKTHITTDRPQWTWLIDIFNSEAFLLAVRKEGRYIYSIEYVPFDSPKQFNNLDGALADMWWRLGQVEQSP